VHHDKSALWVRFSLLAFLLLGLMGGVAGDIQGIDEGKYYVNGTGGTSSISGLGSYDMEFLVKADGSSRGTLEAKGTHDYGNYLFGVKDSSFYCYYNGYNNFGSFSEGQWYKVDVDFQSSFYKVYIEDQQASECSYRSYDYSYDLEFANLDGYQMDEFEIGSFTSFPGSANDGSSVDETFDDGDLSEWSGSGFNLIERNSLPTFNSTSVSPDPVLIGESVSYGAEVFDSDGSISYTNLTLSYGGSTVLSDEKRTGTTPEWNDIYKPSSGNKWLNATFETVDDDGATTTTELNRYLTDTAPAVNIKDPANQTYYSYDNPVEVSVNGGDSNPDEEISCTTYLDGNQVENFTGTEPFTHTSTVSADLGSHEYEVTCSDPAGNSQTESVNYEVEDWRTETVYSDSQAYETVNKTFEHDLKTGSMVEDVEFDLVYSGSEVASQKISSTGIQTIRPNLKHEIPLVSSNKTSKNWRVDFTVNRSLFTGGYTQESLQTSQQSQEVLWSYWIKNHDTVPGNGNYIETEDLKHQVTVGRESGKASLQGSTIYQRNGETVSMQKNSSASSETEFEGVVDVGKADSFNQSTFQVSSSIDISFNGKSRSLTTGNDPVNVYKIKLTDGSTSLNTAKALEFDVNYEEDNYDTETRLTMDLSVWKNRDELIRRYKFKKDAAQEHSFHIYPAWAEYKIRTLPYPEETKFDLIQYWNQDTLKVRRSYFFPTTQTISNETTSVPLKTLNSTEASRIDFTVKDSAGQAAKNTYCRVDRKFGGGDFETVFMIKTGNQGNAQSFAEVNEIYYSFTCYKDGEIVETFPSQIMQDPMLLTIGEQETESSLDYQSQFDSSCTFNQSQISCSYQSSSEKLKDAELTVDRLEPVQDKQVCRKTSPTITGELTCNGLNTSENNYEYRVEGNYPSSKVYGSTGVTGTSSSSYGSAGILLTLVIFLFTFAATSFNIPLGIATGTVSLIFSSIAGFWVLTPSMRATLIALAIIAGVVARK